MANFFYDRNSGDSSTAQWANHIQTPIITGGGLRWVDQQTADMNAIIGSASKDEVAAIRNSSKAICGTLERGFSDVSRELGAVRSQLADVGQGIRDLHAMLDWKTDLIIEQQKISNVYLGNIARLLQIPDSQKQRAYYVEQGLVYLKNAIEEGTKSAFYKDSMDEFQKAKEIEDQDFFTLHRLGLIHMHALEYLDVPKAEGYFATSARYAKAYGAAQPVNAQSILNDRNVDEAYSKALTQKTLYDEAANSLVHASRCCYILQQFPEGLRHAEEAFRLAPHDAEAGLQLAKMLCVTNNPARAAEVLEKTVEIDRYYSLKAIADRDLITRPQIQNKLNEIAERTLKEAKEKYEACKKTILPGSPCNELLDDVAKSLSTNDFLGAKKALDLLTEKQQWQLRIYSAEKQQLYTKPTKLTLSPQDVRYYESLYDNIRIEAEQAKKKQELIAFIEDDFKAQKAKKAGKKIRRWKIRLAIIGAMFLLAGIGGAFSRLEFLGGMSFLINPLAIVAIPLFIVMDVYLVYGRETKTEDLY